MFTGSRRGIESILESHHQTPQLLKILESIEIECSKNKYLHKLTEDENYTAKSKSDVKSFSWNKIYKIIHNEDRKEVLQNVTRTIVRYSDLPKVPQKMYDLLEKSILKANDSAYKFDLLLLYSLISPEKYILYRRYTLSKFLKKSIEKEKANDSYPDFREFSKIYLEFITDDASVSSSSDFYEDNEETSCLFLRCRTATNEDGEQEDDQKEDQYCTNIRVMQRIFLGGENYSDYLQYMGISFEKVIETQDFFRYLQLFKMYLHIDSITENVGILNIKKKSQPNSRHHDPCIPERMDFMAKYLIEGSRIFIPHSVETVFSSSLYLIPKKSNNKMKKKKTRRNKRKDIEDDKHFSIKIEEEEEEEEEEEDSIEDDYVVYRNQKKSNKDPSSFSFFQSILQHQEYMHNGNPFSDNCACVFNMKTCRLPTSRKKNSRVKSITSTTSLLEFSSNRKGESLKRKSRSFSVTRKNHDDIDLEKMTRDRKRRRSSKRGKKRRMSSPAPPRRNIRRNSAGLKKEQQQEQGVEPEQPYISVFNHEHKVKFPKLFWEIFNLVFEMKVMIDVVTIIPRGKPDVEFHFKDRLKRVVSGLLKTVRVFLLQTDELHILEKMNCFLAYLHCFNECRQLNDLMEEYVDSQLEDLKDFVMTDIQTQPWSCDRRIPFDKPQTSYGIRLFEFNVLSMFTDMMKMEISRQVVQPVFSRYFHQVIAIFDELYTKRISPSRQRLPQYMMDVCSIVQTIRIFRDVSESEAVTCDLARFLLRCSVLDLPLPSLVGCLREGKYKGREYRGLAKDFHTDFFGNSKEVELSTLSFTYRPVSNNYLNSSHRTQVMFLNSPREEPSSIYSTYDKDGSRVEEPSPLNVFSPSSLQERAVRELRGMPYGFPKTLWVPVVLAKRVTLCSKSPITRFERLLSSRISKKTLERYCGLSPTLVFSGLLATGIVGEELKDIIRRRPDYKNFIQQEEEEKKRVECGELDRNKNNGKKVEEEETEGEEEEQEATKNFLLCELVRLVD